MKIKPLGHSDQPQIIELLNDENLPTEDLQIAPVHFFGIKNKGILAAIGALEIYKNNAILRSVVVKNEFHGKGFGKRMTQIMENRASQLGINQLFLLTTTAPEYFQRLDYHLCDRSSCPEEIQQSAEFKTLCPSSAICLNKSL